MFRAPHGAGRANPHGTATSRNSPHGLPTHWKQSCHPIEANTSRTTFNWPLLSPAPKNSFPQICTTNRPGPSPAPHVKRQVSKRSVSRLPPKVRSGEAPSLQNERLVRDRQVSKTSVSHETSSKSEAPSLQNQRFVKCQVSKTSVSYETSSKSAARNLACIFAPSTRAISAEGCAGPGQNAILPAFRALDTHDLRRGLRATRQKRNLTCVSRPRRARSPQRAARAKSKTQTHLHFAPSTRTISAEGCAGPGQIAISPAFRALDARSLRRGLRRTGPKRNLACISLPRRARSPQRVAFRDAPAAPPPGLKRGSKEEREVKMCDVQM